MSSISNIIDQIYTTISTNYSFKTELFDPYELINNDEQRLENGFGVVIGPGTRLNSAERNFAIVDRELGVILTKVLFETDQDSSIRRSQEKSLLDEALVIEQKLTADGDLKQLLASISFTADSGIDYIVFGENEKRYIFTALTFIVKYRETLTLGC